LAAKGTKRTPRELNGGEPTKKDSKNGAGTTSKANIDRRRTDRVNPYRKPNQSSPWTG
jgi:hypothetical protein